MTHEREIVDAAKARVGADRMAAGLPCVPDATSGDLDVVLRLQSQSSLKSRIIERLPLCPDHRDKVRSGCCWCEVEWLRKALRAIRDMPECNNYGTANYLPAAKIIAEKAVGVKP